MKKKYTIQIVAKYFHPVNTGLEVNMLNTYKAFVKNGYAVTVYTTTDTHTHKNVLKKQEVIEGIKVKRYNGSLFGLILAFQKQLFKKNNVTILHEFDTSVLIYLKTSLNKIMKNKKNILIFSSHGLITYTYMGYPGMQMRFKNIFKKLFAAPLINNSVDGIRAVSEHEKEKLTHLGIRKDLITVIKNGIEIASSINVEKYASEEIKQVVKKYSKYILQMGRIDKVKNYEATIHALSYLPKDIYFLIAGPDQDLKYKDELRALIQSKKFENRVIFLGLITGVDKYYLMKKASVFVHLPFEESFGNVVNEAMSQGQVCIVSKNTALTELVQHELNGFVVDPKNNKDIVKSIRYVLNNKKKLKKMQIINKKRGANNSWDDVAKKVESFYSNIAAETYE